MQERSDDIRFFLVGDIGEEGVARRAVAKAMASLQKSSSSFSSISSSSSAAAPADIPCSFVLTTGDNIYDKRVSDSSFGSLVADMLSQVPLPWFACLGNHDVKNLAFEWHIKHSGESSSEGWSWNCPAPSYSVDDTIRGLTKGLIDIFIINTSKMKSGWFGMGGAPPAPSEGFYTSNTRHWWKEQKENLEKKLITSKEEDRWRFVVGHHPAEYVYSSFYEQRMPIVRYFKATYMKGGRDSRRDRWALTHILRRHSDFYACGHQHLMAHLKLRAKPPKRDLDETHCNFVILGNSSTLDNEEGEFDEDYDSSSGVEEQGESFSGNGTVPNVFSGNCSASETIEKTEKVEKIEMKEGPIGGGSASTNNAASLASDSGKRYETEWVRQGRYGFATVLASKTTCVFTFFSVNIETGEYAKLYEIPLSK